VRVSRIGAWLAVELRFVRFNRAGEQLLGIDRAELLGRSDRDVFPAEQAESFVQRDREALASLEPVDVPSEPIISRTHGPRLLHTRKIAIRDASGVPRFLLGISEDITP
jgi:PAS domain S-box-containing protein